MTDTPYNMPPLGLFGKRCRILTGYDKRPFVYRIVNSELMSNAWCEPPITYQSGRNPVRHDHSENVLIVVLDTLIDENSRLIRVALKDVELMDEAPDNAGWISVKDSLPEAQSLDDDNWVLVWFGEGSELKTKMPIFGRYDAIYGTWTILGMSENTQSRLTISHWMPLPKPPKEG